MNKISIEQVKDTHDKLREILIEYGCEEYGDCIVDEISLLFNFPTTIDVEPEEDQFFRRKQIKRTEKQNLKHQ